MKLPNGELAREPDMGVRIRSLRMSTGKTAVEFQRWLNDQGIEVTYSAWINYERGYPIYWRTARRLMVLFPTVDMNYFYLFTEQTMELARQLRCGEAVAKERSGDAIQAQPVPA
jgi:hypothetical protein